MPTPPNPIVVPGTVPDPTDTATFDARAYAWTIWERDHQVPESNALGANVYANAVEAYNNAQTAVASAAAAQALAGAVAFNAATNYAQYQAAISTVNLLTYRRKTAGISATDPSADPANWVNTGLPPVVVVRTGVNTNMLPGVTYIVTAAGITLTLPAVPGLQDLFAYRTRLGVGAWTLAAAGGNKIEGQLSNYSMDVANAKGALWYDATDGFTHIS